MTDASRYTVSVRKTEVDGEVCFEARAKEFPDIVTYGESALEAYELVLDAVETIVTDAQERARAIPQPQQETEGATGRITLRLPKSVHARAVERAQDEGVSLNTYLVSIISEAGARVRQSDPWFEEATSPGLVSIAGSPSLNFQGFIPPHKGGVRLGVSLLAHKLLKPTTHATSVDWYTYDALFGEVTSSHEAEKIIDLAREKAREVATPKLVSASQKRRGEKKHG